MVKRETEKVDKRMQPGKPIEGKPLLSETEAKKLVPIPKLQVYRPGGKVTSSICVPEDEITGPSDERVSGSTEGTEIFDID